MKVTNSKTVKVQDILLDVRELPPPVKHQTIFREWEDMEAHRALLLINDHDPLPLKYQFDARFPNQFQWEYLERGPHIWRVRIRKGDSL